MTHFPRNQTRPRHRLAAALAAFAAIGVAALPASAASGSGATATSRRAGGRRARRRAARAARPGPAGRRGRGDRRLRGRAPRRRAWCTCPTARACARRWPSCETILRSAGPTRTRSQRSPAAGCRTTPARAGPRAAGRRTSGTSSPPPAESKPCTETRPCGIDAPRAWKLLRKSGHPDGRRAKGKRGPIVAVVDTGVAYRDKGSAYSRSPDLGARTFVDGWDFVNDDSIPLDRNGHGTHVASTVAEATDNGRYVTGLGDGLRIMPIRVLDGGGAGSAADVARGNRLRDRSTTPR